VVEFAGMAVGGFIAGFAVAVLIGRRRRRLRVDWQLIIESDENDGGQATR
jgi:hypothetical protein